ncbi:hypothetical protein AAFF_G00168980 [Aldrovandia affinis]|uniref:Uncharacterized protein n=1 Tax=Aldrovandia affinis TaxID=143900 RepID=A0AAD7RMB3_9TELE|nr:hypothetical protein AAFF_G00168980 [Aldrovandia affinis]
MQGLTFLQIYHVYNKPNFSPRRDSRSTSGQYRLPLDGVQLLQAKKTQALASDQDYKTMVHSYTVLLDDMKVQWAYDLQSEAGWKAAE